MKKEITKKKFSVTLDPDVYKKMEEYVDLEKTKRSRLIEKLLKEYLEDK